MSQVMDREYCNLVYRAFVDINCNQFVKEDKSRLDVSLWLPDARRRKGLVNPITMLKTSRRRSPYANYILPSYDQQFDKQEDLLAVLEEEILPEFKDYAFSIMVQYHDSEQEKQQFIKQIIQRFSLVRYETMAMVLILTDQVCKSNDFKLQDKHPKISHIQVANTSDRIKYHMTAYIKAFHSRPDESYLDFYSHVDPNNSMMYRIDAIDYNGEIIATGELCYNPELNYAFICHIGVLPDFRRCGIGEYVTRLLIQESMHRKADFCLLNATEMGKGLYEKIEFSNVGHITYVQQTFWD